MIGTFAGAQALANAKTNNHSQWNRSPSSAVRSTHGDDASNRIYDGLAQIKPTYRGPKFAADARVFTMGSCFAREIEGALIALGGQVVSMDRGKIAIDEFKDTAGNVRTGFFHRFTPFAMAQEFERSFGQLPGWDDETSLLAEDGAKIVDMNYWEADMSDLSAPAVRKRRKISAELVSNAATADLIVLTPGLIESWFYRPQNLHANRVPSNFLVRHRSDLDLVQMSFSETLDCLNRIRDIVLHHNNRSPRFLVTVSPVPLSRTFTPYDLIVANMTSKSTLRAAAAAFCGQHADADYFPSYEIVTYSDPDVAWRPDRTHVQPAVVQHIVSTFVDTCFEQGAFGRA